MADEQTAKAIVRELITTVKKCHDLDVVHRDIKADNIMFATPGDLKNLILIDFGVSRKMDKDTLNSIVGTIHYMRWFRAKRMTRRRTSGRSARPSM